MRTANSEASRKSGNLIQSNLKTKMFINLNKVALASAIGFCSLGNFGMIEEAKAQPPGMSFGGGGPPMMIMGGGGFGGEIGRAHV